MKVWIPSSVHTSSLRVKGCLVIDFKCPFPNEEAERIVNAIYSSDGGEDLSRTFAISGEPWHPMVLTNGESKHLTAYENWQLNLEKDGVKTAWLKAWNATKEGTSTGQPIDGLLLPISPFCAHRHGEWPRKV